MRKMHRHNSGKRKFDETKALKKIDDRQKRTKRKDREFDAPIGSEVPNGTFSQGKSAIDRQIEMAMKNVQIDPRHFDKPEFRYLQGGE